MKPHARGGLLGSKFRSNPRIIRVPFFLMVSFNRETPKLKGKKGTTGVPRSLGLRLRGSDWNCPEILSPSR